MTVVPESGACCSMRSHTGKQWVSQEAEAAGAFVVDSGEGGTEAESVG